jgi:hypothetical protein
MKEMKNWRNERNEELKKWKKWRNEELKKWRNEDDNEELKKWRLPKPTHSYIPK